MDRENHFAAREQSRLRVRVSRGELRLDGYSRGCTARRGGRGANCAAIVSATGEVPSFRWHNEVSCNSMFGLGIRPILIFVRAATRVAGLRLWRHGTLALNPVTREVRLAEWFRETNSRLSCTNAIPHLMSARSMFISVTSAASWNRAAFYPHREICRLRIRMPRISPMRLFRPRSWCGAAG